MINYSIMILSKKPGLNLTLRRLTMFWMELSLKVSAENAKKTESFYAFVCELRKKM